MNKSRYDLYCPVQPDKICPAKSDIIREATGDASGYTQIDNETTEFIVQTKFREQDAAGKIADLTGHHGDITEICPVRPVMNNNVIRRTVLDVARAGFRRFTGRQSA